MNKFVKIAGGILSGIALFGGLYINSQRENFIRDAVNMAEEKASQAIGTQVKIGSVDVDEVNFSELAGSSITVRDIEILDKDSKTLATADEAKISFKLLSLYDDAAGAIDEINISRAKVDLTKRADDSWNFEDIKIKSEGESNFGAKITVTDSAVDAEFDGKKISVTDISATADCADLNAVDLNVDAKVLGSSVDAAGIVGVDNQIINARIDSVDIAKVLPYLPEDTLPDALTIHGGKLYKPQISVKRHGDVMNYNVASDVQNCAVKVEDTEIKNIHGKVNLNEERVWFDATATANGQVAAATGNVFTNTDEIYFDIYAESENFSPAAVISNIGVEGAASFTAHLTGTTKRPQVEADIFSPFASYQNFSVQNLSAHVNYGDDKIYLTDVSGETFGGELAGDVTIDTPTLTYNAHVKANGIDAAQILNFAGSDVDFSGKISADVALNGMGVDMSKFKLYGGAEISRADFQGFTIDDVKTSFYYDEKILQIDNLNAVLPNRGAIGLEGKIIAGNQLDLDFFASHVDLASAKKIDEKIDVSGLADLIGSIHGNLDNPQFDIKISAVDNEERGGDKFKGILFNQPYDSIKIDATGGLDDLNINNFTLEKAGKIIWKINGGHVALTGDKRINLEVDTTGARLENIIALVALDQKITGNIDNKIKITGTIDKPDVIGNVKLHYGMYNGILITGMEGNYFYEGDKLKLENFVVTSPMADVVLNGTFDTTTKALDFAVEGQDISLKRFQNYFPEDYYAEGHGTFTGNLTGTVDEPDFKAQFIFPALNCNGVDLADAHGEIDFTKTRIIFKDFYVSQGDGHFKMNYDIDRIAKFINGNVELLNVDIPALAAIANQKNFPVIGKLNSNLKVNGTRGNFLAQLTGNISAGEIGGHDIHDVELEITQHNRTISFNKLNGKQGDKGTFNLIGQINPGGVLDLTFNAQEIALLGMINGAANLGLDVEGTSNINAKIGGTVFEPTGEGTLTATGSVNGATFDLLKADVTFQNWAFHLKEFFVQREVAGNIYKASAAGTVPIRALYIDPGENIPSNEQLNLTLSLDDANLSLLPVMNKFVEWAVGDIDGSLKITGTAEKPQINGRIAVNDGTIKIKFVESPIEHLNISTQFNGDRFKIEKFGGNVGKGNFEVTGGFNFANFALTGYNFGLKANALEIQSWFFNGPLNAEFTVNEDKTISGRALPKIAGHLDLDKCTISVPSIPDSDEPLPEVIMDISINLGEKVHLYSSHLYDMYLTGSARFEGTTRNPKTSGSIKVKRGGTLTYINSVFDIREGEAHFNQLDSFFPTIHFYADTRLSRTKVFLYIDGSLEKMTIKLGSSPAMTETEIIQALTLRENYQQGKDNNLSAADILTIGLQMSILGDIEDAVRRTVGLDQLRLTRGTGSAFDYYTEQENHRQTDYNIFLGKYITDKIMLRYTQGLTGEKISRYGFQYDINDKIGITVEREKSDWIFGVEAKFNF